MTTPTPACFSILFAMVSFPSFLFLSVYICVVWISSRRQTSRYCLYSSKFFPIFNLKTWDYFIQGYKWKSDIMSVLLYISNVWFLPKLSFVHPMLPWDLRFLSLLWLFCLPLYGCYSCNVDLVVKGCFSLSSSLKIFNFSSI